ncbi:Transposable element P transposase [Araneus ventricosus]|uniref:Transposable element P transposase n=1 Tax=Araneus ventricosus TaxID=182803 RepID=A0A4Y2R8K3_ARAVE|nr:Transposable element P transposase [Araneus ventricosus]
MANKCCSNKNHTFLKNARKILTETQINAIANSNKKIKWTSNDISRAVVLRALNRKSYDYWREKIKLPLPSPSTLKRWCSQLQCYPGVLENVLKLMSKNSVNMSPLEKTCILSFDEIRIDNNISNHNGLDQALGPHSKVQVVLAQGILSPWKQPIFYDFDKTMDTELLSEIICKLEKSGMLVSAIVSDLGGCSTLWKELEISCEKTFFIHPCDANRKVWVFADMPHYIKLLRNHFLDSGLLLNDGTVLNSNLLIDLLKIGCGEVRLCYQLKPQLLFVTGNARQKVGPAKAVFSRTVSKAILKLLKLRKQPIFLS